MTEDSSDRFGPWRYYTKIRVKVDRQRIEEGYSLDCFGDRLEADTESERVLSGYTGVTADTLDESLPTVDTLEIPSSSRGVDRRGELLSAANGGNARSVGTGTDQNGGNDDAE